MGLDVVSFGSNSLRLPQNTQHFSRKDELMQWFGIHKPDEAFVIIDDDKSLNELPPIPEEAADSDPAAALD